MVVGAGGILNVPGSILWLSEVKDGFIEVLQFTTEHLLLFPADKLSISLFLKFDFDISVAAVGDDKERDRYDCVTAERATDSPRFPPCSFSHFLPFSFANSSVANSHFAQILRAL